MELIKYKSINNSTRTKISIKKSLLCKSSNILKFLKFGLFSQVGRSSITGRITCRHKCARKHKKKTTFLTEFSKKYLSLVLFTFYDSTKSSFVYINFDLKRKNFFTSCSLINVFSGCILNCKFNQNRLSLGNHYFIKDIPVGTFINNLKIQKKVTYIKSAGTSGQIIQINKNIAKIKLPSGKIIKFFPQNCSATIGTCSNSLHNKIVLGKAGNGRNCGIRPSVRGIAMNPVDHPHGGRTNGGRPSVTPWGKPTKGGYRLKKKQK
jgi:large subunit ribosomal protein L2